MSLSIMFSVPVFFVYVLPMISRATTMQGSVYASTFDTVTHIQRSMIERVQAALIKRDLVAKNEIVSAATSHRQLAAPTASKWAIIQTYTSGSGSVTCGSNPATAMSIGLGRCYPYAGSVGSTMGMANSTMAYFQSYSDNACTTKYGSLQSIPINTCTTNGTVIIGSSSKPPTTYTSSGIVYT